MANIKVRIEIEIEDIVSQRLQLNQLVLQQDLDEIIPRREVLDIMDYAEMNKRRERRARFVDALSGGLAHAITEGIYKVVR